MINFCITCPHYLKDVKFWDDKIADICIARQIASNKEDDLLPQTPEQIRKHYSHFLLNFIYDTYVILDPINHNHKHCPYFSEREVLND